MTAKRNAIFKVHAHRSLARNFQGAASQASLRVD